MKKLITLCIAGVVLLTACGGDEGNEASAASGPGDFTEELLTQITSGQFGRAYETMHPAQQEFVDREFYVQCADSAGQMPQLESVKIVETYEEDAPIPGADRSGPSTAVTYEMTLSVGDETRTVTDTSHLYDLDGEWRWVWSAGAEAANGSC